MSERNLEQVLHEAADYGLKIFHAAPGEKGPRKKGWKTRATSDKERLSTMAETFPEDTFGVLANGITIIDLDVKLDEGQDGVTSWESAAKKNSAAPYATPYRETHGGGRHLYFKGGDVYDRTKKIVEVGEYRTNSDFCVIWRDGKEYPWAPSYSPTDIEFQPVPTWVSTLPISNGTADYQSLNVK